MKMELTTHQKIAFERLQRFCSTANSRCFVLRGYAGTGKTTLIGYFVKWLQQNDFTPILLATTGRAAKVLANKTSFEASTVHACLYQFEALDGMESLGETTSAGQLSLNFGIREKPESSQQLVYIVDEASMIANTAAASNGITTFGSGHLLVDFLDYTTDHKVVFVGDPCQLPPVSADPFSPALSPRYLRDHYQVAVQYAELGEIVRQTAESEILQLAGRFRKDILLKRYQRWAKIYTPRDQSAHLYPQENALLEAYLKLLRKKDYQQAQMITYANRHCRRLNHRLRMSLFDHKHLRPGELLMVVQNNPRVPLANGDQVLLESVKPDEKRAGFFFLEVKVRNLANNEVYSTLLIRDLLYNEFAGLQNEESKRLLIDFHQRARKKGLKPKMEAYKEAMRTDPYLNALRAKFGYVITCHKAQGGEWPHVFLNLQKSLYVIQGNALYRWFYTAITRASEHLHLNDGFWIQGFSKRQPDRNAAFFKRRSSSQSKK